MFIYIPEFIQMSKMTAFVSPYSNTGLYRATF